MRRMKQEGRVALLWGLLFFACAQLALNISADRYWPEVRDPSFGRQFRAKLSRFHTRLAAEPDKPLVLMLGSSQTAMGFQADRMNDLMAAGGKPVLAFNFGIFRSFTIQDAIFWRDLRAEGVRPALLLVELGPLNLSGNEAARTFEEEHVMYIPGVKAADMMWLRRYLNRPNWMSYSWIRSRLFACYGWRFALMNRLAKSWLPPQRGDPEMIGRMDRSGWIPHPVEGVSAEFRHVFIRDQYETLNKDWPEIIRDFHIGTGPRSALADLLAQCSRDGIQAAIVLMPQESEYRRWFPPNMEAQLQGLLADFTRTYNVSTIDARLWVPDDKFLDHVHLAPTGATVFTDRLTNEVRQLLAQDSTSANSECFTGEPKP